MLLCSTDNLCKSRSILPATDWPLHFLLIALKAPPIFITAYFTVGEGALPRFSNRSFPSALHPSSGEDSTPFPFFFSFPCSHLSYLVTWEHFLILRGVQGPLLAFSRGSVRISPPVHVFLICLWGAVNPKSSCSTILTTLCYSHYTYIASLVVVPQFLNFIFFLFTFQFGASLMARMVKNLPAMQETWVRSLGQEEPLEKGKATHSGILAWSIPLTGKPGGL